MSEHPQGRDVLRKRILRPYAASSGWFVGELDGLHGTNAGWALAIPEESERYCREMTRREARNFYWGFVALPRHQRIAIYALYGFARQVDDAVDIPMSGAAAAPNRFDYHRARLQRCFDGQADDPIMEVLAWVVRRYQIPLEELDALIQGVERDIAQVRYETWPELRAYCELVASTVGRMCVRVFGFSDPAALGYADELGVAMQLTNILRDVREDAGMGRIYLPQQDLAQFGVDEAALLQGAPGAGWEALVAYEAERARDHFARGLRVTEYIPRRAAVCVFTMAGIYQEILEQIARDPYLPLRARTSLDSRAKLGVMLRSWLQAV